jgi:hypothetical protein
LSGKVPDTHPVGAIHNHNLGVFTVTKIAMENTDAVSPAHPVPRTPKLAYPGLQRCRGPSAPLTCLAWPAAWQSLCTGHLDASLKPSALTFTEPGPPEQKTAAPSARLRLRQRGRVVNTDRRGSVFPDSSERFRSGRREGPERAEAGNVPPSREWGPLQKRQEERSQNEILPLFDRAAMSGGTRAR